MIGDQQVDLIIGGPPCQAYSIVGRAQDKDSMRYDYRNYLLKVLSKLLINLNLVLVFENVPGLLTACPGDIPVTERIFRIQKNRLPIRDSENYVIPLHRITFRVPQKEKGHIIGTYMDGGPDLINT